jgi:hypothetical protein
VFAVLCRFGVLFFEGCARKEARRSADRLHIASLHSEILL